MIPKADLLLYLNCSERCYFSLDSYVRRDEGIVVGVLLGLLKGRIVPFHYFRGPG